MALGVVPFQFNARKLVAFPINGNFVVFLEDLEEVIGMLLANILNAKVVHYQEKFDWAPLVAPEPRGSRGF